MLFRSDRGTGFLSFAPRVLLNQADLPATGLVQPASRLTYRLAVAAPPGREDAVAGYARWMRAAIQAQGLKGVRVESLQDARPEMRQTLERADKFLNLVALLAALLAAVAVSIAARDFAQRHLDDCALLRVHGVSQGVLARAYAWQFGLLGLAAGTRARSRQPLPGALAGARRGARLRRRCPWSRQARAGQSPLPRAASPPAPAAARKDPHGGVSIATGKAAARAIKSSIQ